MGAVRDKNLEFVEALLSHSQGADASLRLKDDFTPLHSAVYQKDTKIAQLLVTYNANVNAKVIRSGWTPLHGAVMNKNEAMVSLLIEYGADPETKAQKRDIRNGDFLTCDQLAQEIGFANYEQIKRKAKEKEGTTEKTTPNANPRKTTEEPLRATGTRRQDGSSTETEKPSGNLAEEEKVADNEKTIPQGATGGTETSDQKPAASYHEENTKKEKPDVNSWMKNYKKQKKGKTSPGEQKPKHQDTNEKIQPRENSSSSKSQRETVHEHSEEEESQENRKENLGERPKATKTREERRSSSSSTIQ